MHVWLIEIGESLSVINHGVRDWRCGNLSKALIAQGHTVTWWASTFDHSTRQYITTGPRIVEPVPGLQMRLLHGPAYSESRSLKRLLHHFVTAQAFAREAKGVQKPDIIHCHLPTPELAEQAVRYGKTFGVPVVIDIHDLWPDVYLTMVPKGLRGLAKLALTTEFRRIRWILKNATSVLAISNAFLSWGLRNAGREARETDGVFPLGYSALSPSLTGSVGVKQAELQVRYGIQPDSLVLTFVGTFTPSFDMVTVIEAARILCQSSELNVRVVIVGDGAKGPEWRARAQGIDNVTFTGWLDQLEVAAVLRSSSIGLAPYDNELISLPNKPFEYMAAGLPVLSSLCGDLEDLIRDENIGRQYRAGDVASLVEEIRWLAANPAERQAMGQRARELFLGRFQADTIYPRLVRHLEQIAKAGYQE